MQTSRTVEDFLDQSDEDLVFDRIRSEWPDVRLIDGSRWLSPDPPLRDSPGECEALIVYLWSPSVCPVLPAPRERGGRFDGPQGGVVVQWERSITKGKLLLSGGLTVGFSTEDAAMSKFVRSVFKVMKATTTNDLERLAGVRERGLWIGPSARRRSLAGDVVLRHRGTITAFYGPGELDEEVLRQRVLQAQIEGA